MQTVARVKAEVTNDKPTLDEAQSHNSRKSHTSINRVDIGFLLLFLSIGIWVTSGHWLSDREVVSSHLPNDNVWFEWLFAHAAYSITHWENPLFSLRQNFPDGVNMAANTSILAISLPLAPITILWGPSASYVIAIILGLAGTAGSCYYVFSRHLVESRLVAAVAGIFCGFAPGIIHHANGQPNFTLNFLVPFIVLAALTLARSGSLLRNGVILGTLVALQYFLNQEILLLTAAACITTVVFYSILKPAQAKQVFKRFITGGTIAAAVGITLLAYPIWMQFFGPQSYTGLPATFSSWGEDLAAFVTYSRDTIAGNEEVEKTLGLTEQNTWFGVPLVLCIVVAGITLWRTGRSVARITILTGVGFAILSLGPQVIINGEPTGLWTPWWKLFHHVPMLKLLMPTRLNYVLIATVGVLIALALEHARKAKFTEKLGNGSLWRYTPIVASVAITISLIPLFPTPLPTKERPPLPKFFSEGTWRDHWSGNGTILSIPAANNTNGLQGLRWSATTLQEFPIPMGYFLGPSENRTGMFGAPARPTSDLLYNTAETGKISPITEETRRTTHQDLDYWNVDLIVLGPQKHEKALKQLVERLIEKPARRIDGVWMWNLQNK